MKKEALGSVVDYVRACVGTPPDEEASDAHLVERFAREHDGTAFASLVKRHGGMVFGICRRVAGTLHDAEDAFQATFLVLARRAAAIRRREALASWLHAVACRVATKARQATARRRQRELRAARPIETSEASVACAALEAELDDALGRLPEKYRVALLLCYFQGRTVDQAAAELGCPRGTVASRLAQGRALLRCQLERRGLALSSAGLLTFLLANSATACPAAPLVTATVQAGVELATRTAAPILTTSVAALIAGGTRELSLAKATVVCLLLVLGALVAAAGVVGHQPPAPEQKAAPAPAAAQKAPQQFVRTDAAGDPLPAGALARIGTLRFRHPDHVDRLAFTPDAKVILSQGTDGIRTWDVATGKELKHFHRGPDRNIQAWTVSADGKLVVVLPASPANILSIYVIRTGQQVRQIRQERSFQTACFAPTGNVLLTTDSEGVIKVWDSATGEVVRSWQGPSGNLASAVFSGDGKVLATFSAGGDHRVRLWDPVRGKQTRAFLVDANWGRIALSTDGKRLATLGYKLTIQQNGDGTASGTSTPDGLIRIWDAVSGKELRRVVLPKRIKGGFVDFAFGPDGKSLVTVDTEPALRIWDVATAKERRRIPLDCYGAFGLACSRDGRMVTTAAGGRTIRLFDAHSGKDLAPPGDHQIAVDVLLPGKAGVLVTISDRALGFWDAATGRPRHPPHTGSDLVTGIRQAREGGTLFVQRGKTIEVWDSPAGKMRRRLTRDATGSGWNMAVTPNGKILAQVDRKDIRVVDALTGKELQRLSGHEPWALSTAFIEGGKKLVVFGVDHRVHIWDVAAGRKLVHYSLLQPPPSRNDYLAYTTAISPDSRLLAYGSQNKYLALFELATGKEVVRFSDLPDGVCPLVFSPDGRTIIWAGWRSAPVRLMEVATGKERHRLVGHKGRVTSLDISADGKLLASGSGDTTALIWDLSIRPTGARLSDAALTTCWTDLASADAARAYQAMRRLAADPARAVPFLDKHLQAIRGVSERHLKQLLADLQAPKFSRRNLATQELEALGDIATPACRELLRRPVPLDLQRRLENILKKHAEQRRTPPAELVRGLRALEVLEMIGGPDAVAILTRISRGAPGAWLTTDAKGAVARLRN